jgi:hypothetical protein
VKDRVDGDLLDKGERDLFCKGEPFGDRVVGGDLLLKEETCGDRVIENLLGK